MGYLKTLALAMVFGPDILAQIKAAKSPDSPGGTTITIEEMIMIGAAVAYRLAGQTGVDVELPTRPVDPDTVQRIAQEARESLEEGEAPVKPKRAYSKRKPPADADAEQSADAE